MNRLGLIVAIQGAIIALLVAFIVLGRTESIAEAQVVSSSDSLVVEPVHLVNTVSVAYVVDPQTQRLLVYEYEFKRGLRLVAARNIKWDLKMESYNALSPKVSEVRDDYLKSLENKQ